MLLHQLADQLNAVLKTASDHLRDLGLGVIVDIPLATGRFGFQKLSNQGGFQLAYRGDVDDVWIPIASASREVRIQAAAKLAELEQALRDSVDAEVQRTSEAIKQVEEYLRQRR